ncbi:MAG: RnfABCDGE type electron transport complex subunit D [Alkalispirochaetaceae bacterium]
MFQKQVIMRRVVYSLTPLFLFSIYLYGWRPVAIMAITYVFGIGAEYIMERGRKKKVSEAVLVTCSLYGLSLPPITPFWVVAVGIIFAVIIGKEVYGGFGRNIYNPAITGRLFIYISFAAVLSGSWAVAGNFGAGEAGIDAITAATPLAMIRGGEQPELMDLFLGLRAGSIGESSTVLILAAAVYLIWTGTANWRLILSTIVGALAATVGFFYGGLIPELTPANVSGGYAIAAYMMSGSILYVAVFMSTDPVSGPNRPVAQYLYGFLIGAVSMTIRTFSGFPEGTSFAILIGNTFASLFDEWAPKPKKAKKKAPAKSSGKKGSEAKPREATA